MILDYRLIASVIEIFLLTLIILKFNNCESIEVFIVALIICECFMVSIYLFIPEIGVIGYVMMTVICNVLCSEDNILKRTKVVLMIIPTVVLIQGLLTSVYLMIDIINDEVFFTFTLIAIVLEFLVLRKLVEKEGIIMVVFAWFGKKEKKNIETIKKEKEAK